MKETVVVHNRWFGNKGKSIDLHLSIYPSANMCADSEAGSGGESEIGDRSSNFGRCCFVHFVLIHLENMNAPY